MFLETTSLNSFIRSLENAQKKDQGCGIYSTLDIVKCTVAKHLLLDWVLLTETVKHVDRICNTILKHKISI